MVLLPRHHSLRLFFEYSRGTYTIRLLLTTRRDVSIGDSSVSVRCLSVSLIFQTPETKDHIPRTFYGETGLLFLSPLVYKNF